MRSSVRLTAVVLSMSFLGIAPTPAGLEDAYRKTTDVQKIAWMDKGMEAVRTKLRDPASAEFKDVYFHRGTDDIPMTCGRVNAKNGFGGTRGYQRFLSAGSAKLTYLEEEVQDFETVWKRYCQ